MIAISTAAQVPSEAQVPGRQTMRESPRRLEPRADCCTQKQMAADMNVARYPAASVASSTFAFDSESQGWTDPAATSACTGPSPARRMVTGAAFSLVFDA